MSDDQEPVTYVDCASTLYPRRRIHHVKTLLKAPISAPPTGSGLLDWTLDGDGDTVQ